MNGRAPAYVHVNEVTLWNPETREFRTFWKNVHQQRLITTGHYYGLTYEIEETRVTDKEAGNAEYLACKAAGFEKWIPGPGEYSILI